VAFCTQNIVPGVDFSNDPLLQGRNFSYLDTQLKRLGSPNFTFLPINAPKCPFHTLQQDGHMALGNPRGRVNYEPNSWGKADGGPGPREAPDRGFHFYPAQEDGAKQRIRSETFADHYSQARQFYVSQTELEQQHIIAAFTFELSKVETLAIRSRMVGNLLNVDEELGKRVAAALRLRQIPAAAQPARPVRKDLPASNALSILKNGPKSFRGRKVGALVTDGIDAKVLTTLKDELEKEGAVLKLIAPQVGGVNAADGSFIEAHEKLDGGPSVLFDAVAILVSDEGARLLLSEFTARDFIADAFAHLKFIAYTAAALPLLAKAGAQPDDGCTDLGRPSGVKEFVQACAQLRHWARAPQVKQI
jgi:catalase